MKILIVCDKFKFTYTSIQIGEIISNNIKLLHKNIETEIIPISDGGEGFLDAIFYNKKFVIQNFLVHNAINQIIKTFYYTNDYEAFIESAKIIGLQNIKKNKRNPFFTSTFGIGEAILDAYNKGFKKINIGLGGSSTNDAGFGMAVALGYKFYDKNNLLLMPIPENLIKIFKIDKNDIKIDLSKIDINILSDVKNTLFGKNGASKNYAAQKGANQQQIIFLEKSIIHFNRIVKKELNLNIANQKGTGAAGGLAYGLKIFANGKISYGADYVTNTNDLKTKIKSVDIVITGEGQIDNQTNSGKIVKKILDLSLKLNKKTIIICGVCEKNNTFGKEFKIYPLFLNKVNLLYAKKMTKERIFKVIQKLDLM